MDELEQLATSLAKAGYYPQIHRRDDEWSCALWNNKMTAVPTGTGATALEALKVADWDRQKLIKDGRLKK